MSDSDEDRKAVADVRIHQGRSPAYPYLDLERAIRKAEQIRDAGAARTALPPETFYKVWGIGPQSSGARQTMAALNQFGLVDYIGRGDERKVKLSDLALSIIFDRQPNSPERHAAIRRAALEPTIHSELHEKYGPLLPSDVVICTYLVRDRGYNESAANNLVEQYKMTLAFAGLDRFDDAAAPSTSKLLDPQPGSDAASIPRPFSAPPDGAPARYNHYYIDPTEKPDAPRSRVEEARRPPPDHLATAPSESVWLSGPLGRGCSYKLVVSGDIGTREISRLIKVLETQMEVLSDEGD